MSIKQQQNTTNMTNAAITKTLKKVENQSSIYSLGFNRLTSLPIRVRKKMNLTCVSRGETNDDSIKNLLNGLSEQDFINWLKSA